MRVRFLRFKNWLLLSLMGALGLNSCKSTSHTVPTQNNDQEAISRGYVLMYGVPSTDYRQTVPTNPDTNTADLQNPKIGPRDEQPLMYGVPTVDFHIKGKVTDEKGRPIKGIQVILLDNNVDITPDNVPNSEYINDYLKRSADTTDANGTFSCSTSDRPMNSMRVVVRDVDGSKNGQYESVELNVDFSQPDAVTPGESVWNQGSRQKNVDITLKRKK